MTATHCPPVTAGCLGAALLTLPDLAPLLLDMYAVPAPSRAAAPAVGEMQWDAAEVEERGGAPQGGRGAVDRALRPVHL